MKEFFTPELIATISSCAVAFFSMLTALFMTIKQKYSVDKANAYASKAQDELAAENAKLRQQILEITTKEKQ